MEAWIGGKKDDRPKLGSYKAASQQDCERILVEMILKDYLKQTFHANAYNFTCYLSLGPLASQFLRGSVRLSMDFEIDIKACGTSGEKHQQNGSNSEIQDYNMDDNEDILAASAQYEEDEKNVEIANLPETNKSTSVVADEDDGIEFCGEIKKETEDDDDCVQLDFGDLEDAKISSSSSSVKIQLSDEQSSVVMKRSVSIGSVSSKGKKKRGLF